jgi:tripartite-type tricarboxylate transporter receptor subunit TctC
MKSNAISINRRKLIQAAGPALLLSGMGLSFAASYPTRPIKMVVAYPPGGSADILSRMLAAHFTRDNGWQVLVEQRVGAAGLIGTEYVAKALGDGHTLIVGSGATHGSFVSLYPNLPYDPIKDFVPISNVAALTSLLVVHPSVPARTVKELIAYAKANPGKLAYGSGGNGSNAHLAMEIFNHMAGTKMLHVPYKGNPPAVQDLLGGQIQVMVANMPSVVPHLDGKRVIAVATAALKRSPILPDLPTVAESGLPKYNADVWQGLLASAGTPPDVVAVLNASVRKIMQKPEVLEQLRNMGAEAADNTAAEFAAEIQSDIKNYRTIVQAAGIKL